MTPPASSCHTLTCSRRLTRSTPLTLGRNLQLGAVKKPPLSQYYITFGHVFYCLHWTFINCGAGVGGETAGLFSLDDHVICHVLRLDLPQGKSPRRRPDAQRVPHFTSLHDCTWLLLTVQVLISKDIALFSLVHIVGNMWIIHSILDDMILYIYVNHWNLSNWLYNAFQMSSQ